MLQMLATLLPMDGGSAEIFGVDVQEAPARGAPAGRRDRPVRLGRREPHRPREPLPVRPAARPRRRRRPASTAEELLGRFGLEDAGDKQIQQFSGGMRRRLDLAASLIHRPPLIFLDEPTTGLDPRTRGQMWDTIRELVAQGCTVLLTTQYLDEADQLADRIAVIDRGAQGRRGHLRPAQGPGRLLDPAAAAPRPGADQPGRRRRTPRGRRRAGAHPRGGRHQRPPARRQPGRRRADRPARAGAADHAPRPSRSPPSTRSSWP